MRTSGARSDDGPLRDCVLRGKGAPKLAHLRRVRMYNVAPNKSPIGEQRTAALRPMSDYEEEPHWPAEADIEFTALKVAIAPGADYRLKKLNIVPARTATFVQSPFSIKGAPLHERFGQPT